MGHIGRILICGLITQPLRLATAATAARPTLPPTMPLSLILVLPAAGSPTKYSAGGRRAQKTPGLLPPAHKKLRSGGPGKAAKRFPQIPWSRNALSYIPLRAAAPVLFVVRIRCV